ncbi:MAG: hypothetical protein IV100_03260 [Myxococcales bacterium]|nr:hypothetical protein [Myxococcales bacterium]
MKRVAAPAEAPKVLADFGQLHPDATWEKFKDKKKRRGRDVFDALAEAQGHLCAYCEIRIGRGELGQVEHFIPKSKGGAHLDIANMLAVCEGGTNPKLGERSLPPIPDTMHCGQLKGDRDPTGVILDPRTLPPDTVIWDITVQGVLIVHEERCRVAGIDPALAKSTLEGLGLNRPVLVRLRKRILDGLRQSRLSPQQIDELLAPQGDPLPEFYTTILLGAAS